MQRHSPFEEVLSIPCAKRLYLFRVVCSSVSRLEVDLGISAFECETTYNDTSYPNGSCVTELPYLSIAPLMVKEEK